MSSLRYLASVLAVILWFSGCSDDDNGTDNSGAPVEEPTPVREPHTTTPFFEPGFLDDLRAEQAFPGAPFRNEPSDNPTTQEGFQLGRHLFYEKALSINRTISCGSCHEQEKAFTDGRAFSVGFDGRLTSRSAMSIANMLWQPTLFWEGRTQTLEEQALLPIQDHIEMGMTLDRAVERLEGIAKYDSLFYEAFGDSSITADRMAKAMAQFMRGMVSYNSKYDRYLRGELDLTPLELKGMQLFNTHVDPDPQRSINEGANCVDCHNGGLLHVTDDIYRNNGIDSISEDPGRMAVTGDPKDRGKFKVPTLRNIALTAPYMHDGRFQTLEEVINHYDTGVHNAPNLAHDLVISGNIRPMHLDLTEIEKQAVIAFLHTLTDTTFVNDPRFSDPNK